MLFFVGLLIPCIDFTLSLLHLKVTCQPLLGISKLLLDFPFAHLDHLLYILARQQKHPWPHDKDHSGDVRTHTHG